MFLGFRSYETETLELAELLHRQMQSQRDCVPVAEGGGVAAAVVVGEDVVESLVLAPVRELVHSAQSMTVCFLSL